VIDAYVMAWIRCAIPCGLSQRFAHVKERYRLDRAVVHPPPARRPNGTTQPTCQGSLAGGSRLRWRNHSRITASVRHAAYSNVRRRCAPCAKLCHMVELSGCESAAETDIHSDIVRYNER
jgi:hypothetical protein